jgi:molybdenum cofactor cytidylyltransferase
VVFDLSRYRDQLGALDGDRGARAILDAHPDDVARVPVEDSGVVLDLDTREEYRAWLSRECNRGGKDAS